MYLEVDTTLEYYLDFVLVAACVAIALTFMACITYQHRENIKTGVARVRNSGDQNAAGAKGSTPVAGAPRPSPSLVGSLRMLTPDSIKGAYRQLHSRFQEIV